MEGSPSTGGEFSCELIRARGWRWVLVVKLGSMVFVGLFVALNGVGRAFDVIDLIYAPS
jgi:hypothetical protein